MTNPTTHIPVFEKTVAITHSWLRELKSIAGFSDEKEAYSVLRVVLHAIRDRLTIQEAAHFGAEMPMLVRGFYYEGWKPSVTPKKLRSMESFLDSVAESGRRMEKNKIECVHNVFRLLSNRISAGEIADVRQSMPEDVRILWPQE